MAGSGRGLKRRVNLLRFPLRGPRVDLVPVSMNVVPAIIRLMNEPSVALWTLNIPYPYTAQHGREFVRKSRTGRRAGQSLALSILRRSDGEVLGGVGLHRFEEGHGRAEVGYWLGREHRGQGYATEAVNVLLAVGFGPLGLHRIEARVRPQNLASRRVVRRCGFRLEGRLRDEVRKDGRWRSSLLFSRLASDPPKRAGRSRNARRSVRATA